MCLYFEVANVVKFLIRFAKNKKKFFFFLKKNYISLIISEKKFFTKYFFFTATPAEAKSPVKKKLYICTSIL